MLTKFELRKYKHLKAEMLELQERINEITSVMRAPKIPRLSGTSGGGGGSSDKLCDTLDKLEKLRTVYYQKLGVLADLQLTIEKEIDKLPADAQMLLRLYYFSDYTWEQVAARTGLEWRTVYRRHADILERLRQEDGSETGAVATKNK